MYYSDYNLAAIENGLIADDRTVARLYVSFNVISD